MQDSNSSAAGAGYEEVLKGGADEIGKALNRGSGTKRVCSLLAACILSSGWRSPGSEQREIC